MTALDKLMISIGIDEGSSLDELHQMLKDMQSGGTLKIKKPDDMITKNDVTQIKSTITRNFTKIITFMGEKFPEIQKTLDDFVSDEIIWRFEAIQDYFEGRGGEKLSTNEDLIGEIQGYNIKSKFNDILKLVEAMRKNYSNIQRKYSNLNTKFDKLGKFDDFQTYLDKTMENLENYFSNQIKDIWEISSQGDAAAMAITDFITIISNDLEEFRKDPELEETVTELNLLGNNIGIAIKEFEKAIYDDEKDENKEIIYDLIREEMGEKFVEFKDKLDDNLRGILNPKLKEFSVELNTFQDMVSAIFSPEKGTKSIWKAPGVKSFEEPYSYSGISGFFRELVSWMSKVKPELMKVTAGSKAQGALGRSLEEMKIGKGLTTKDALAFLGIEHIKGESPKGTIMRVVERIVQTNMTIMDIITGTDKNISIIKDRTKPDDIGYKSDKQDENSKKVATE